MIVRESLMINGREWIHAISDEGRYLVRDGMSFDETYDPAEFGRVYTEGDIMPPEEQDMDALMGKAEAFDILTGVSE